MSIARNTIALIGVGILGLLAIYNPITQSVIAGAKHSSGIGAENVADYQERDFRLLCEDYKNASTWSRWTKTHYRELSWCEKYLDRL
jgi:hypothetical protein